MRLIRNLLAGGTFIALGLALASYVYAVSTDTSQSDSNANLGETWAHLWLYVACLGTAAVAFAALLAHLDRRGSEQP